MELREVPRIVQTSPRRTVVVDTQEQQKLEQLIALMAQIDRQKNIIEDLDVQGRGVAVGPRVGPIAYEPAYAAPAEDSAVYR